MLTIRIRGFVGLYSCGAETTVTVKHSQPTMQSATHSCAGQNDIIDMYIAPRTRIHLELPNKLRESLGWWGFNFNGVTVTASACTLTAAGHAMPWVKYVLTPLEVDPSMVESN
jgi:hypothetical protein